MPLQLSKPNFNIKGIKTSKIQTLNMQNSVALSNCFCYEHNDTTSAEHHTEYLYKELKESKAVQEPRLVPYTNTLNSFYKHFIYYQASCALRGGKNPASHQKVKQENWSSLHQTYLHLQVKYFSKRDSANEFLQIAVLERIMKGNHNSFALLDS